MSRAAARSYASLLAAAVLALAGLCGVARPLPAAASEAAAQVDQWLARDHRPDAAAALPTVAAGAVLLDVRSDQEWAAGHARDAIFLPWRRVADDAASKLPDRDAPVIVYCAVGVRAWWAVRSLRALGYTRAVAMSGGYDDMVKAGYPVVTGP